MDKVVEFCTDGRVAEPKEIPPPLSSEYKQPDKDTAIKERISRFNKDWLDQLDIRRATRRFYHSITTCVCISLMVEPNKEWIAKMY